MKTLKSPPCYLCVIPFLLLIHNLNGQGTVQTQLNPDCPVVSIGLTLTAGSGATITVPGGNGFDNRVIGCQTYTLQYVATATSGSLTGITFQAAGGAATPGTFSAFPGTVSTGINPNTSNTGAISTFSTGCTSSSACTIANAWLNVLITRGTFVGTIQLVVYGWKNGSAKAGGGGGGGGGGPTIAGTVNQITATGAGCTNPSTATCTIALANNTVLPGNPSTPGTMTAVGFISDESASGNLQMKGLTSGNVTLTVADIAGTAIAYMWPSTNGTAGQILSDSGVATCPTLPAGAPTVCHQLTWIAAGGGGTAGGGVLGYSATALILPTSGTTFLAPVGGALASTTEANVTANAPAAAAISNMYVTLSAAPGTGNTVAFTFRDAGSSTVVTCTISGASATSCNDKTHSFTPVVGDALAVQVVTTGTVVITPTVKIIAEYGVTGGGGGTTVTAAPPYIELGTTFYTAYNMYQATLPTAPTYLNSVTCTSATTGTNGDLLLSLTSGQCWGGYAATTSVEGDFNFVATGSSAAAGGIWIWDSTNNNIYIWVVLGSSGATQLVLYQWTYNGSGNPSFNSQLFNTSSTTIPVHLKIALAAGTLTFSASMNGGSNLVPITTVGSIGTVSKAGFVLDLVCALDLYSIVVI